MEDLFESLLKTFGQGNPKGVGLVLAFLGLTVWGILRTVHRTVRKARGIDANLETETSPEEHRPRRRIPLY